jgi:hypothetical protein
MIITNTGNVGIGTSAPGAALHVAAGEVRIPGGTASVNGFPTHFRWPPDGKNYIRGTTIIADDGGDVGIGTSAPGARLHVVGGTAGTASMQVRNTNASGFSGIEYLDDAGTVVSFLGVDNANNTTRLNSIGFYPIAILTESTERVRVTSAGDVGIGTTAPSSRLHVNGGDVRVSGGSFIDDGVTLNVPDYVFESGYELLPLEELAAFVNREKHLPNVPKAEEIKASGLNLGQFQMRLLEKLEELTLYTLAQHEALSGLREENEQLRARLEALERAMPDAQ